MRSDRVALALAALALLAGCSGSSTPATMPAADVPVDLTFSGAFVGHLTAATSALAGLPDTVPAGTGTPPNTDCTDGRQDGEEVRAVDLIGSAGGRQVALEMFVTVGTSSYPRASETWVGRHDVGVGADPGVNLWVDGQAEPLTSLPGSFSVAADGTSGSRLTLP